MAFLCDICKQEFALNHNLTRHMNNQHGSLWSYQRCNQTFNRCDNYEYHQRTCLFKTTGKRSAEHLVNDAKKFKDSVSHVGGALDNILVDNHVNLEDEEQDAANVLKVLKESIYQLKGRINEELEKKKAIKFYVSHHVNFNLGNDHTFITGPPAVFNTEAIEIYESSKIDDILSNTNKNLVSSIEDFQHRGSGLVLDRLLKLYLHILEFNPLRATSYIPVPLRRKKPVINIQCFLRSVIAGAYLKDVKLHDPQRPAPYKNYEIEFNLRKIEFPMKLSDIPRFQRQNNMSISVYGYYDG